MVTLISKLSQSWNQEWQLEKTFIPKVKIKHASLNRSLFLSMKRGGTEDVKVLRKMIYYFVTWDIEATLTYSDRTMKIFTKF